MRGSRWFMEGRRAVSRGAPYEGYSARGGQTTVAAGRARAAPPGLTPFSPLRSLPLAFTKGAARHNGGVDVSELRPQAGTDTTPRAASFRDPWGWLAALSVLPLFLRARGAPLGEPVAEDFDFLH